MDVSKGFADFVFNAAGAKLDTTGVVIGTNDPPFVVLVYQCITE